LSRALAIVREELRTQRLAQHSKPRQLGFVHVAGAQTRIGEPDARTPKIGKSVERLGALEVDRIHETAHELK
jgi:hypothetical protein